MTKYFWNNFMVCCACMCLCVCAFAVNAVYGVHLVYNEEKNKKKQFYNYWRCERQINNKKWASKSSSSLIVVICCVMMKTEVFVPFVELLLFFHSFFFFSKWSRVVLRWWCRWRRRWRVDDFIWDLRRFLILEHFVLPSNGYQHWTCIAYGQARLG